MSKTAFEISHHQFDYSLESIDNRIWVLEDKIRLKRRQREIEYQQRLSRATEMQRKIEE